MSQNPMGHACDPKIQEETRETAVILSYIASEATVGYKRPCLQKQSFLYNETSFRFLILLF